MEENIYAFIYMYVCGKKTKYIKKNIGSHNDNNNNDTIK